MVKVGDRVPDLDVLVENSPGNKVNLAKELKGKGLIIGVPAAFSMVSSKPMTFKKLTISRSKLLGFPHPWLH